MRAQGFLKELLVLWAMLTAVAVPAAAAPTPVGLPLADGPDPYGPVVARLVGSFTEFSRWPDETKPIKLCIVEPTDHADRIAPFEVSRGRKVRPVRIDSSGTRNDSCDVIYLGRLGLAEQRTIIAAQRGRPVLTIAENDPACRSQSMFCLIFAANSLSFRMNLDAVSRSGVRVDPRVLRLASPGQGGAE